MMLALVFAGMLILTGLAANVAVTRLAVRARLRARRNGCMTCGYDHRGNPTGVCPECGTAAERRQAA